MGNVVHVLCAFVFVYLFKSRCGFLVVFIRGLMESDFPMQGLTFTKEHIIGIEDVMILTIVSEY